MSLSMDNLYSTMMVESTWQGQALDLAQTNVQMGLFGLQQQQSGNARIGSFLNVTTTMTGTTTTNSIVGQFARMPLPSGTIHHHPPSSAALEEAIVG